MLRPEATHEGAFLGAWRQESLIPYLTVHGSGHALILGRRVLRDCCPQGGNIARLMLYQVHRNIRPVEIAAVEDLCKVVHS